MFLEGTAGSIGNGTYVPAEARSYHLEQVRAESSGLARTLGSAYALHEGGLDRKARLIVFDRVASTQDFCRRALSQVSRMHDVLQDVGVARVWHLL